MEASNNELVRTKTLVKSAIVQVDAAPFKQWYLQHYGVELGCKKKSAASVAKKEREDGEDAAPAAAPPEETKKSNPDSSNRLVKSAIVQVDAAPFKQWYLQHYGAEVGRKKKNAASSSKKEGEEGEDAAPAAGAGPEETKKSNHVMRKIESRQEGRNL